MDSHDVSRAELLRQAIEAFGEAWANGDDSTLRSMLSPTYTHNDAFGEHLNYDAWLTYAQKRAGRATRITFRDVEVRIIQDVGIVTGFNDMTGGGITSPTDPADLSIAFTQVWVWRGGRWMREAFQATPVLPASAT